MRRVRGAGSSVDAIPALAYPQSLFTFTTRNVRFSPLPDGVSGTVSGMPMRATTVRFGDDLWSMLEREATRHGVSSAQFVRDATILRIAYLAGERGDPATRTTVAQLAAEVTGASAPATPEAVTDPERLAAVRATGLLQGPPRAALDRVAGLAARIVRAPVALISLVDAERQVFAGCVGLAEPWATRRETPLSHSVCQHALGTQGPFVVEDIRADPLLAGSPAVTDLGVVAYVGIPLVTDQGLALGTLCVIDHRPRAWTPDEIGLLTDLAASAVSEIRVAAGER